MSPNPSPSFVYLLFVLITRATHQLTFLHVGTSVQSRGEEQRRELKCQTHDKKAWLGDPPRACHVFQLLDTCFSSKHRGFIFKCTTHTLFSTLFIYVKAPTSKWQETHAGMLLFFRAKAARQTLLGKGDEKHDPSPQNNPVLSTGGGHAFPVNIIIWNYGTTCNMEVKLDFIVGFTQIPAFCRVDFAPRNTVPEGFQIQASAEMRLVSAPRKLSAGPYLWTWDLAEGRGAHWPSIPGAHQSTDGYRQASGRSLRKLNRPRGVPQYCWSLQRETTGRRLSTSGSPYRGSHFPYFTATPLKKFPNYCILYSQGRRGLEDWLSLP